MRFVLRWRRNLTSFFVQQNTLHCRVEIFSFFLCAFDKICNLSFLYFFLTAQILFFMDRCCCLHDTTAVAGLQAEWKEKVEMIMKDFFRMKEIQKRQLLQILLGFFLGRVDIFGINPVGIAFFAVCYSEAGAKIPVGIAVTLGMLTAFPLDDVVIRGMAMLAVMITVDLLEKQQVAVRLGHAAVLLGASVGALAGMRLYLVPHDRYDVMLAVIETVLAVACTRLLYDGEHFLLYGKRGQSLGNEEMFSLILLGAFTVLGIPSRDFLGISWLLTAVYLLTLMMGYCYGTGVGAVCGCICGAALLISGWDSSVIGVITLLGIAAGLLREQGKLFTGVSFFFLAMALPFMISQDISSFGDAGSAAIAGGIFFLLPEHIFGRIQIQAGGWADNWESEQLQELIQHKLRDFSASFQKLSRTLGRDRQEETVSGGEIRQMMEMMSEEICGNCKEYGKCEGSIVLLKPEMVGEISVAKEMGQIQMEQLPGDFARECTCKEEFLSQMNQNIHLANVAMGYQNRMEFHRQVIAEQLQEVGTIVGGLSEQMPLIRRVSQDMRENIIRSMRRNRVIVKEIAFYEKFDGRLEIHIQGRTWRGRYVTTREAAEMLSEELGILVQPAEECRKFFPREEDCFVFEECARLRAETGVSRLPREGEEISGDTFSCLSLSEGELFLALSDGMGSGDAAYQESEMVIDLLEQMTEAGFSEASAIRLINSLYMSQEENRSFATADITLFNLYEQTCHFVKCGASTTYLYHGGELLSVEGEALPIGIMAQMEPYMRTSGIDGGDCVIMMTDGVADCFATEESELEGLILRLLERRMDPQQTAEEILSDALGRWGGEPGDDMSVLVVKIYRK